jgi:hypothetical protein
MVPHRLLHRSGRAPFPHPAPASGDDGKAGLVRLPVSVHRQRPSLDFPTRPAASSAAGGHRISRFSRKVWP